LTTVVPDVAARLAPPPMPSMAPPVELMAPVSEPFFSVPPARETALIVCAKPPRSRVRRR